jgi:hypothetical protein
MTIPELKRQLRRRDARIKEQGAIIAKQAARIAELERQVEELKKLLVEKANSKEAKPPKEAGNYSVARHEQKQRKRRRRKKSTGRKPKEAKRDQATQIIELYWHGICRAKCILRREQFVWRRDRRQSPVRSLPHLRQAGFDRSADDRRRPQRQV